MNSLYLSCFHNRYPLIDVLNQLAQLPINAQVLEASPHEVGFSLRVQCDEQGDAQALQTSLLALWPDMSVQVQAGTPGPCTFVAVLMAPVLQAKHLAQLVEAAATQGLSLLGARSLAARAEDRQAWQLRFAGEADLVQARAVVRALADRLRVDINLTPRNVFGRQGGLICFDMDSTLIKAECIDELAAAAGIGEQVSAITAAAMRGELDFRESFSRRMALLNGLPESELSKIAERIELMDGAKTLVNTLKARGFHTAILSGGFVYFAEKIQARLGIDEIHANALEIVDGKVTGRVTGTVVDGQRKAELIQQIAKARGVALAQVIAVGDGANDLPMLSLAGMGVAIHAKPLVRASADFAISTLGLESLCYLLGMEDDDLIREP
ncbi:phosphoserine phosphatase SerB [Simiduia sp. 21SJ11W-1]|uniref:phosphoserine phosphatase SerB n=1 Tax=Simiduia sp. 21SJ11W-1 TaxID=2909669 RepID=UPI00209EEDDE|nr:phosphoserine phosphatase SerB [Simiduia sp. 21SJ11W-1]UTA47553.1 phosphoserine phosphatase SerB [Simiduia sp. 21SJ11W-1]